MRQRKVTAGSRLEAIGALQCFVEELLRGRANLRVLEAGCGPSTRLSYSPDAHVVGIDTDPDVFALNRRVNEPILADLHTCSLPHEGFDLVVSWYVFEHLVRPDMVFAKLADAVRPGGLIVLAMPNVLTPKSVVTKLTPHRFHVWFARRVLGQRRAGTPGYGPNPTTLRFSIAPARLRRSGTRLGLDAVHIAYFEDDKQRTLRRRLRITGTAWRAVQVAISLATAGIVDAARTEVLLVFRKREPHEGPKTWLSAREADQQTISAVITTGTVS